MVRAVDLEALEVACGPLRRNIRAGIVRAVVWPGSSFGRTAIRERRGRGVCLSPGIGHREKTSNRRELVLPSVVHEILERSGLFRGQP
jgi:hypothetical protein